jgi:transcriptional regulator with XRE-family HTH domain
MSQLRTRIATRIRELRTAKGLTLDELAALATTSRGFIWEVEKARKAPSVEVLELIARALDVELTTFFDGKTPGTRAKANPPAGSAAGLGRRVELRALHAPPAEIKRFAGLAREFFAPYTRRGGRPRKAPRAPSATT